MRPTAEAGARPEVGSARRPPSGTAPVDRAQTGERRLISSNRCVSPHAGACGGHHPHGSQATAAPYIVGPRRGCEIIPFSRQGVHFAIRCHEFVSLIAGVEIHAPGHRRRPADVKAQLVAQILVPGASVSSVNSVAGRHVMPPHQLPAYRRLAKQEPASPGPQESVWRRTATKPDAVPAPGGTLPLRGSPATQQR